MQIRTVGNQNNVKRTDDRSQRSEEKPVVLVPQAPRDLATISDAGRDAASAVANLAERARNAGDIRWFASANVVGVDVEADDVVVFGTAQRGTNTANSFRKHHRCPAVDDAHVLLRAAINRQSRLDEVVANFSDNETHVLAHGANAQCIYLFESRLFLPDRHQLFLPVRL